MQTLSCLPGYNNFLKSVFTNIKPSWLGITSLFYDGDISSIVKVNEHANKRIFFHNTYSLKDISRFSERYGYEITKKKKV